MATLIKAGFDRRFAVNDHPLMIPIVFSLVLFLAIFFGVAVALFGSVIGIALGGLVCGAALITAPRLTVWVTLIGGLAISGLVELYLPGLQAIRWAFAILSIALAVISTVKWLADNRKMPASVKGTTSLAIMLAIFVSAVLLSILASQTSLGNAVVGLKNYFQMWGIILALAWLGYKPIDARRFLGFLGFLSLIQMPFVLHQFLVLVPQRSGALDAAHNIVAVDIVAGTFGGNMAGGGRSADLAILTAIAVTLFFAQWKAGRRRLVSTLLLSALAFAPILFNEAKLALVLLPVGLFLLFRHAIIERPFAWLLGASVLSSCMALIVVIYSLLPGAAGQRSNSVADFVSSSLAYNVGDKGYGSAVLNRSTVYKFWWREHQRTGDIMQALLGHGPGFSSAAAIARGDNAKSRRYVGYAIGLTGLSTLLWDTGALGAGAFILMLFMAYRLGQRLTQKWSGTLHEPFVQVAQISIALIAISMLHNDYVAFDIGFQTMLALLIGYLFAMAKAQIEEAS